MTLATGITRQSKSSLIDAAVLRHRALSVDGLLERAFSLAFRKLVYAQIWEDPVVDLEALDVRRDSRIVTIASGGCNVMSYLTAEPDQVYAVDLNTAHVALNRLKESAQRLDHPQRSLGSSDMLPIRECGTFDTFLHPISIERLSFFGPWTRSAAAA